jgi:hypothetical protein
MTLSPATARRITLVLQAYPYAEAADVVRELWPGTKQPRRLARVVAAHVRAMDAKVRAKKGPRNGRDYARS